MPGGSGAKALGTGFFVAQDIFLTCDHVINGSGDPHQDGDSYLLVANLTGASGKTYPLPTPKIGQEINLFPNLDLAVVRVPIQPGRPFAAVGYAEVFEGDEIGVVGYPIPELQLVNGNIALEGLIYRAAKGHVTGRYVATLEAQLTNVPILEVNFLFVPGNSGGPVFAADTGRVVGFVRGYRTVRIREVLATVTMLAQPPLGLSNQYIESLNAIYSLAFKLDFVRATLESFGVVL